MHLFIALFGFLCLAPLWATAATLNDWRARSIYQVMTDRFALSNGSTTVPCDPTPERYCGGSWRGIINNLDYIQNMGFTAVWISPVVENIVVPLNNTAYHGYWAQNIYQLNENFGTVSDLQDLSQALHNRNMFLMADIVVNHMAWDGNASTVQYGGLNPFNTSSYFHSYCDISENTTACWQSSYNAIPSLPDLRTEDFDVRSIFQSWITTMVSNYSIDGLRLDSAKNVETGFFPGFAQAANIFCTGEVLDGAPTTVCPYSQVLDSVLNYPVYFQLVNAFVSPTGDMSELVAYLTTMKNDCKDTTTLGSFSENHDQPRVPSYTNDLSLVKNVLVFTMFSDGIPIIYQGQEQHLAGGNVPANREAIWLSGYNTNAPLYSFITTLNVIRQQVISVSGSYLSYKNYVVYNDSSTIVMRKGYDGSQLITVLTNAGSLDAGRSFTLTNAMTGFNSGDLIIDLISCTEGYVDGGGNLLITRKAGLPSLFYAAANIRNTTICVNGTTTNPNVVSEVPVLSGTATSSTVASSSSASSTPTSKSAAMHVVAPDILLTFWISGFLLLIKAFL